MHMQRVFYTVNTLSRDLLPTFASYPGFGPQKPVWCIDQHVLAMQIVYAVRAKTTLAVDLKNVEENGARTMANAFQVRP